MTSSPLKDEKHLSKSLASFERLAACMLMVMALSIGYCTGEAQAGLRILSPEIGGGTSAFITASESRSLPQLSVTLPVVYPRAGFSPSCMLRFDRLFTGEQNHSLSKVALLPITLPRYPARWTFVRAGLGPALVVRQSLTLQEFGGGALAELDVGIKNIGMLAVEADIGSLRNELYYSWSLGFRVSIGILRLLIP